MYCVKYEIKLDWLRSMGHGSGNCRQIKKNRGERKFPHGNFRQWVADIFR